MLWTELDSAQEIPLYGEVSEFAATLEERSLPIRHERAIAFGNWAAVQGDYPEGALIRLAQGLTYIKRVQTEEAFRVLSARFTEDFSGNLTYSQLFYPGGESEHWMYEALLQQTSIGQADCRVAISEAKRLPMSMAQELNLVLFDTWVVSGRKLNKLFDQLNVPFRIYILFLNTSAGITVSERTPFFAADTFSAPMAREVIGTDDLLFWNTLGMENKADIEFAYNANVVDFFAPLQAAHPIDHLVWSDWRVPDNMPAVVLYLLDRPARQYPHQ
ncbi:hypothetical protein M1555_01810 [Patescibacteria group bacterium]|nr:hypothetical protein [Patescibacteria group bacterium]